MTFIDWSDSEGMFGLLVDVVADELADCSKDLERQGFLEDLLEQLRAVATDFDQVSTPEAIEWLAEIQESADSDFATDPVMVHLEDCLEELRRVDRGGGGLPSRLSGHRN